MSYVEEIFKRANMNSIREYLEFETEPIHRRVGEDFENRLNHAHENFRRKFFKRFPGIDEEDSIFSDLATLSTEQEETYMEIGIIVGVQIANEFKHLARLIE